jgi:hypothetical protein
VTRYTPNRTYPYPEDADQPDGSGQMEALALAVDTDMQAVTEAATRVLGPWTTIDFDTSLYEAVTAPQYRTDGLHVYLRFRLNRVDGGYWANGETLFAVPEEIRQNQAGYVEGLVGVTSAASTTGSGTTAPATVRLELNSAGNLRFYDQRKITEWVGLNAHYLLD